MICIFLTDDIECNIFSDSLVQRSTGSAHTVSMHSRSIFPTLPSAVQNIVATSPPLVSGHPFSSAQNGSPAGKKKNCSCTGC